MKRDTLSLLKGLDYKTANEISLKSTISGYLPLLDRREKLYCAEPSSFRINIRVVGGGGQAAGS